MTRFLFITIIALGFICSPPLRSMAQDDNAEPRYVYRPFDDEFERRMDVTIVPSIPSASPEAVLAMHGEGWIDIKHPDFSKGGPWITSINISSTFGARRISLIDHAAYNSTAWWVTDKLVGIRVWWGRLVGTVAVYDIENNSWPHREMFSPKELLNQLGTTDAAVELTSQLDNDDPFEVEVMRGPYGGRPAFKLRFDSATGSIGIADVNQCTSSVDDADMAALREAIDAISVDRASRKPACKPGPCPTCTFWSVEILANDRAEMYSQRSSCLSADPAFRKLILQVEAIATKHLTEDCFTPDDNLNNSRKGK